MTFNIITLPEKTNKCLKNPFQIATVTALQQVREALWNRDVLEWVGQRRPKSKWVVDTVTNIALFIIRIRRHPIVRGTDLPAYLAENHGLVALDCNCQTGRIYNDNLCFFKALALHNGCHSKSLERDAQHYYERY